MIYVNHLPQFIAEYIEFSLPAPTPSSVKETASNSSVFLCLAVTPHENQWLCHWHIALSEGALTYKALLVLWQLISDC